MRTSPILRALFPKVRSEILAVLLGQPEREWYLSEFARFLKLQPSSLQREIAALSNAGIVSIRREDGRRIYLRADTSSPVFSDLKSVFDKTAGLLPILREELTAAFDKVETAFVYGSISREQEHSKSDVDLMLVGEIGLAEIAPGLRRAERRLGRPVNPIVLSPAEFRKRIRHGDHFLSSVLQGTKQFLKGDIRELVAA